MAWTNPLPIAPDQRARFEEALRLDLPTPALVVFLKGKPPAARGKQRRPGRQHRRSRVVARPCLTCGRLTTKGSRCPTCQAVQDQVHERRRGTRQQRGYTNDWGRIVRDAIAEQPWCSVPGCTDTDLTGDHITPLSRGGENTRENCRVLCRRHNSQRGNRM